MLNKALLAIEQIQKIQENNILIKALEDENKLLLNSTSQIDKMKLGQNMKEIERLKNEVKNIELKIINEWSIQNATN